MKKISPKNFISLAINAVKAFPRMFSQYYLLFLVGFMFVLVSLWGSIFYAKAYRGILDAPETKYKLLTIPEDQIEKVRAEIKRRENVFSNPPQVNYQDPFR